MKKMILALSLAFFIPTHSFAECELENYTTQIEEAMKQKIPQYFSENINELISEDNALNCAYPRNTFEEKVCRAKYWNVQTNVDPSSRTMSVQAHLTGFNQANNYQLFAWDFDATSSDDENLNPEIMFDYLQVKMTRFDDGEVATCTFYWTIQDQDPEEWFSGRSDEILVLFDLQNNKPIYKTRPVGIKTSMNVTYSHTALEITLPTPTKAARDNYKVSGH